MARVEAESTRIGNVLSAMFSGAEADFVPVAPLFVDCPFRGYVDERLYELWGNRLAAAGGDRIEVDFEDYADGRVEILCKVVDCHNSPPCWIRLPWTPFRQEVEGCSVARQASGLVWIDRDGCQTPLTEKLRRLDRRPGPWPMERPVSRGLDEVREILALRPESLVQPESLGDPGSRWESASEQDLRAEGCLTAWDRVRERYGHAMPAYVVGACPTQLLQDTMGFESLMIGFIEAPDVVHEISRLGLPSNRAHWQAVRQAGVEVVHVSEYSWGGDVSPEVYGEFIAPYTRQLIDYYHELGFRVLLYVMGDVSPVLDQIAAQPFDALAIEEGRKGYQLDVGDVRRAIGADRLLFGNVPCMLVAEGAPEDILAEVRRQIEAAGRDGRFVVSIGEPLPPGTQPERVRFFCDSTRLIRGTRAT